MKKKKGWTLAGVGICVLLSFLLIYWFYFSKPSSFLTNEQLVKEMNRIFPEATASIVQDTVRIDERHIFVPFVSKKNKYGVSYWEWNRHKWKVISINTTGQPHLWRINPKDPSTFQLVWNLHPDDQLSYMKFYFIRGRGYYIAEEINTYNPRVQMEKKVSLQEKSYGVMQLPDEWVGFMDALIKVESVTQSDVFSDDFFSEHDMFFCWIPYDQSDKVTFPESSVNGSRYSTGNGNIDRVGILDEEETEIHK